MRITITPEEVRRGEAVSEDSVSDRLYLRNDRQLCQEAVPGAEGDDLGIFPHAGRIDCGK